MLIKTLAFFIGSDISNHGSFPFSARNNTSNWPWKYLEGVWCRPSAELLRSATSTNLSTTWSTLHASSSVSDHASHICTSFFTSSLLRPSFLRHVEKSVAIITNSHQTSIWQNNLDCLIRFLNSTAFQQFFYLCLHLVTYAPAVFWTYHLAFLLQSLELPNKI